MAQNSPNVIAQHLSPSAPTTSHPRKAIRQFAVPDLKVQQLTNRSRANFQRILYSQGSSPPHPTPPHHTTQDRFNRQSSPPTIAERTREPNRTSSANLPAQSPQKKQNPCEEEETAAPTWGAPAIAGRERDGRGRRAGDWRLRVSR